MKQFSNMFSRVEPETAENWLRALASAWNRFIRTAPQDGDDLIATAGDEPNPFYVSSTGS